jgi:hypothetical protein
MAHPAPLFFIFNEVNVNEAFETAQPSATASAHSATAGINISPMQPAVVQPPDPFDPARLRLVQSLSAGLGVKRVLASVPVKKPIKEWFVRTHTCEEFRIQTCVIDLKSERELYLVDPSLWDELASESTFGPRLLIPSVNKQGVLFLWPLRLPKPDGRFDEWGKSEMEAATRAMTGWVRMTANQHLGAYDVYEATGNLGSPEWPTMSLSDMLRIAFRDRHITTLDHPVLKNLRGE